MKQSESPNEIMVGIKSSKNYRGKHFIGFDGGSFAVEDEESVYGGLYPQLHV